jgi:hypothetical protein
VCGAMLGVERLVGDVVASKFRSHPRNDAEIELSIGTSVARSAVNQRYMSCNWEVCVCRRATMTIFKFCETLP